MTRDRFHRIAEIFAQAAERGGSDSLEFVDEACGDDPDMRNEVISLLESRRDDGFLEPPAPPASDGPLEPGRVIGSFKIIREIDRGGMGVVYLARDTRLDRDVALKFISPDLVSDSRQRERFRIEALAAASVTHPAVATIHALEERDGDMYIVSEYVPGASLAADIQQGHGPEPSALLELAMDIASGMEAAHARGVVHRDLKPANVVHDGRGRPKILDFGLALVGGTRSRDQRLTEPGRLVGSPAYMAPEQLTGKAIDFRADIFAFGVLLAEVAGRHPFAASSSAGTIAAILEDEPLLDGAGIRGLPGLDRVLGKCLRKDPEERYAATGELVADLGRLRPGPTVPDRSGGLPAPGLAPHWWAFHQVAVILLYVVALVSMLGIRSAGPGSALAYLGIVICGSAGGIMRVHLLFTSRFNRDGLASELRRTGPWMRRIDAALCSLLGLAGLGIFVIDPLVGSVLLAVAVGYLVVSRLVEPATTAAVFAEPRSRQ
jgi:serine/threonine protein kinase